MKHTLLLLSFFLLSFLSARGQDLIAVTPNPAEQTFIENLSNLDLELKIYTRVQNLTRDTLRLRWQRQEMGKPAQWLTQVCDPNACYLPGVSTNIDGSRINEPVVVPPDSAFTLILYVLPNGMSGNGAVDLDFSLASDPDRVIETIMFRAEVRDRTTSLAAPNPGQVRLFPNPAADYIELANSRGVDQLVVYNLLGRAVRQFSVNEGKRYNISGLPDGMYLVSLVSRERGILRTLRLSKRSLRP